MDLKEDTPGQHPGLQGLEAEALWSFSGTSLDGRVFSIFDWPICLHRTTVPVTVSLTPNPSPSCCTSITC